MRLVGQMDVASLDVEQAQPLGWETKVSGGGSWTVGGGDVEGDDDDEENEGDSERMEVSRDAYFLRKGDLQVHIMAAGRTSLTETEVEVTVNDAASLSDEVHSEVARLLVVIGFATDEQAALENASVESKVNEWLGLAIVEAHGRRRSPSRSAPPSKSSGRRWRPRRFDIPWSSWYSPYRRHEVGPEQRIVKIAIGRPEGPVRGGLLFPLEVRDV